jgi:hypothetical protein
MILRVTLLITLLIPIRANSQEYSLDFGKISIVDFSKDYEHAADAKAIIIFDKGESEFIESNRSIIVEEYGVFTNSSSTTSPQSKGQQFFDIRFTRRKRIKINHPSAIKYEEVQIPIYSDGQGNTERATVIQASTYNLEGGEIIKSSYTPGNEIIEEVDENHSIKKFTLPNVKEGSIIEYWIEVQSPFKYKLPVWYFQDLIPTVHSEYRVEIDPFYDYISFKDGIDKFHYENTGLKEGVEKRNSGGVKFRNIVSEYVMKDVPAFKDTSFITTIDDYLMKIDFQLAKIIDQTGFETNVQTTWPELVNELYKDGDFGKYMKNSSKLAGKVLQSEFDFKGLSDLEKAIKIIEYIKKYKFDNTYNIFASNSPRKIFESKSGNSADLNLFLVSLLNGAGINAYPVLLSTRQNGKIYPDYPFPHYFDYVIVFVQLPNASFLTDGTEPLLQFSKLPVRCINGKGLLANKESPQWVNIMTNGTSTKSHLIEIEIEPLANSANTKVTLQSTDYEAWNQKRQFKDSSSKIADTFSKKGWSSINNVKTLNYQNPLNPYFISFRGEMPIQSDPQSMRIDPFLDFQLSENILEQEERIIPVDFIYPSEEKFSSTIIVPEGYSLSEAPENFQLDNNLIGIYLTISQADNSISLNGSYVFKKATYQAEEYSDLKSYIDLIVRKFNEKVVFKKN